LTIILYTLNYKTEKQNDMRELLKYCFKHGSKNLVKTCLFILRLMIRAEMTEVLHEVKDEILQKLKGDDPEIKNTILSVLDEFGQYESNVQIINTSLVTSDDKAGDQCRNLMMKIIETDEGFDAALKNGWLDEEMNRWSGNEKWKYVEFLDKALYIFLESMNTQENPLDFKYSSKSNTCGNPNYGSENAPILLASILRLPWNIKLVCETSAGSTT
jgi:hypothetical protein